MPRSAVHYNGHLMCAIDVETTGLRPRLHDILQVCVLPLDAECRPLQGVIPFFAEMKPRKPENIDEKAMGVSRLDLHRIMIEALEADRVADFFDEWFQRLKLPEGKKIIPLAHNWPFDREFIRDWLGDLHFEHYFLGQYRDTMVAAAYENDCADHRRSAYPFPKLNLSYLCSQLEVPHERAHDALADCVATAECYRRMLKMRYM